MLLRGGGKATAIFNINLQVKTQNLGEHWAASAQRLGVIVFGDTEAAALERMGTAIDFMTANAVGGTKAGAERFKAYLDARGVPYSYTEYGETRPTLPEGLRPVQVEAGVVIDAA